MKEFLDSFGKTNFIIILSIVGVILLALIITIIIEKLTNKEKNIIEYYDDEDVEEYESLNSEESVDKQEEIVYIENQTQEEAKKELEEVTKKLIEDNDNELEGPTFFEKEQEEKSIISYQELVNASKNIDEINDALLMDEGSEPITIEELYKSHLDKQEVLDNPVFEEEEEKKFKNSEVISPVFGVYGNKDKETTISTEKLHEKTSQEYLERTIDLEDLELEIKKTEEFLKELKSLKNKLD